jgi:bacteriocin-like protein
MKKINLKGISEILSEKELKNVLGGSQNDTDCNKLPLGSDCTRGGNRGCCAAAPFAGYICKTPC